MLLSPEILKKIQTIEFKTKKLVTETLLGHYRSAFKGHGIEFADHRVYSPGDDVRHIDWRVSARSKEPLIKRYEEERELQVFLVVDVSGSMQFGTQQHFKRDIIALAASMLAYAAHETGDKVGLALFSDEVEHVVAPQKGRAHALKMVRDIYLHTPQGKKTNLRSALEKAQQLMTQRGILFVLSDFMAQDYEGVLKTLARKHDVVAILPTDAAESGLPALGKFLVKDPETGISQWLATDDPKVQAFYKNELTQRHQVRLQAFRQAKIQLLSITTAEDTAQVILQFFQKRKK